MNPIDLEAVKLLFRKCLDNAEALLDSAKDSRTKKRNHIAFHLAVLALEEIAKLPCFSLTECIRVWSKMGS
jgi:AbiV family abortive infection protein